MRTVILNYEEVNQLIPVSDCVDIMAAALTALAKGQVHMPMRTMIRPPDESGIMYLMPAYMAGDRAAYGLKVIGIFPNNYLLGKESHQGAMLLFHSKTGELCCVLNASAVTSTRTAAVSGLATRLLARSDARRLAIIGAGREGRTHLEAMTAVRPIESVRVNDVVSERAQRFAEEMSSLYQFPIEPVATAEEAVYGADIIVTVTNAVEPILKREWIAEGAHLNVVGSYFPYAREVDSATMLASKLYVDLRECLFNEAGDYILAAKEGVIGPDHIQGEIGELLTGKVEGRVSEKEITLFKSLGLAVEDLATAEAAYLRAMDRGVGIWMEF